MKTFKQYIQEEYTYMYDNALIDKMDLYDALVLFHELEYKWSKLKNTHPYLQKKFLNIMNKIFEKTKEAITQGIGQWMIGHIVPFPWDDPPSEYIGELFYPNGQLKYLDKFLEPIKQLVRPSIKLSDKKMYELIKDEDWDTLDQFIDLDEFHSKQIGEHINKVIRENIVEILTLYYKKTHDDVVKGMIDTLNLLNGAPQNIDELARRLTLALNVQHHGGPIMVDYVINRSWDYKFEGGKQERIATGLPNDNISYEQLDQLSNLPTHKWDKELEQEFGI